MVGLKKKIEGRYSSALAKIAAAELEVEKTGQPAEAALFAVARIHAELNTEIAKILSSALEEEEES